MTDPWVSEPEAPPVLSVLLRTSDFRGDHAADVAVAIAVKPGETVEELVQRAGLTRTEDCVEVRVCKAVSA